MSSASPLRVTQGEESSGDEDDIAGLALEGDLGDEEVVPGIEDEEEQAREAAARGHEFDSEEELLGASSCGCGGCELMMRCCGGGVSANPFLIHCACDASQVHQATRWRPAARSPNRQLQLGRMT